MARCQDDHRRKVNEPLCAPELGGGGGCQPFTCLSQLPLGLSHGISASFSPPHQVLGDLHIIYAPLLLIIKILIIVLVVTGYLLKQTLLIRNHV